MKTALLLMTFIMLVSPLHAADLKWDHIIIEKILLAVSKNGSVKVFSQDETLRSLIISSESLEMSATCDDADFVLISAQDTENFTCKKPALVFSFEHFKKISAAVAVFYWQKRRPTIRFAQQRLRNTIRH